VRHFGTFGEVGALAAAASEVVGDAADFLVEAVGDGRLADSSNIFIKVNEKMK
jgi:hypothetical protein